MSDIVENEQVFFTATPRNRAELPPPFVSAGRSVVLSKKANPTVLILGYGLGAMAAIMLEHRPAARILGVEIANDLYRQALRGNATAVRRRGPRSGETQLVRDNARHFLTRTRRRFDLILDDCFLLSANDAVRDPATCASAQQIAARLTPEGVAVRNVLVGPKEPLPPQIADLREVFRHVQLRRFSEWDNVLAIANQARVLDTRRL